MPMPASPSIVPEIAATFARLLPAPGIPVVVACSGGADSRALAELLADDGRWPVVVFHLDHGLRPDSAPVAEGLAADFADREGVRAVVVRRREVVAEAAPGEGIEAAGRRIRYAEAVAVAREHGAAAVCTAHHRDDQVETVLHHLLRGAGPVGAAGIPARRPLAAGVAVVRPLLEYSREQLRAHCRARGVGWDEDPGNRDRRFTRNRLRHDELPMLDAAFPGVGPALLAHAARRAATLPAAADVDDEADPRRDRRLPAGAWEGRDEAARLLRWRRLLRALELPLRRDLLRRLDDLARGAPGRDLEIGGWRFHRGGAGLIWYPRAVAAAPPPTPVAVPGASVRGELRLRLARRPRPVDPRCGPFEAWLDGDVLGRHLWWGRPDLGERWWPLGMRGRKRLGRYLADRGVPAGERARIEVLGDEHGVLWIPGHGIAERARVCSVTATVVHAAIDAVGVVRGPWRRGRGP